MDPDLFRPDPAIFVNQDPDPDLIQLFENKVVKSNIKLFLFFKYKNFSSELFNQNSLCLDC